jgi:hypothetical protein
MSTLFSVVGKLLDQLQPPCAICAAESFPLEFAALEQALRTAYPAEKGFSIRVTRSHGLWAFYGSHGPYAGFSVQCRPVPEAASFSPTRVSVRVSHYSSIQLPAAYLLSAVYFSLIGLAWLAPFVGWGGMPGPGPVALVSALGVIIAVMLGGTALGFYMRATGAYPRLAAQLDDVRSVVHSVLSVDDQAHFSERVKAHQFRRFLGWLFLGFGLLALGLSCMFLWHWWFFWDDPGRVRAAHGQLRDLLETARTWDLTFGGLFVLPAAPFGYLAYAWLRQPAPEKPPN